MRAVAAIEAGVAEAVVTRAFVGVVQDLEGFGGFFEAIDGFLITRVAIGVILHGQLAICGRNIAVAGGSFDAEDFVIVARHGREATVFE